MVIILVLNLMELLCESKLTYRYKALKLYLACVKDYVLSVISISIVIVLCLEVVVCVLNS